nr:MAG TPA: hypothetical protein [Caudoviricetes sp.]
MNTTHSTAPPASVHRMSCMSAFGSILRSLTTAAVITAIIDTNKGSHRHQTPNGTATINAAEAMTAPTAKCWYLSLAMALSHPMSLLISLFIYLWYFESSTDKLLIRESLPDLGLLGKIECLLLVGFEYLALGQIAFVGHQILIRFGPVGHFPQLFGIGLRLRYRRVFFPADPDAVRLFGVDLPVMLRRVGRFRLLVEDHLFVSQRDQFVRPRVANKPFVGSDCCRGVLQTPVDQFCVVVHCFRFI